MIQWTSTWTSSIVW